MILQKGKALGGTKLRFVILVEGIGATHYVDEIVSLYPKDRFINYLLESALEIGLKLEREYLDEEGRRVRKRFMEVLTLDLLDEGQHEGEIYYHFLQPDDPHEFNVDSVFHPQNAKPRKSLEMSWKTPPKAIPLKAQHFEKREEMVTHSVPDQGHLSPLEKPKWANSMGRNSSGPYVVYDDERVKNRTLYWLPPGQMKVEGFQGYHLNQGCWVDEVLYPKYREGFSKPSWATAFGQDHWGIYADISIKNVVQRMRWIKPGQFLMGSPETEPERLPERETQHEVILTKGFWLADTACSQALWQAVMDHQNPSRFIGPPLPVTNVSWQDVQSFFSNVNKCPLALRFPTEAEWEYACRAGTTTPFSFGENISDAQVNYDAKSPYNHGEKGNFRNRPIKTKALQPNDWGLYQMHGNICEWCADDYNEYPKHLTIDPLGTVNTEKRVIRGGAWCLEANEARSSYRNWLGPEYSYDDLGFRFALDH